MSIFKHKEKPIVKKFYSVANKNAPFQFVEAYKMLSTNLEFITVAEKCKNIMITSSLANEGKTNAALNLALTLAGYGKKVCFVECDLRRPTIHRYFDAQRKTSGLTNILTGQVELHDVIRKVRDRDLGIIFAGATPPNPSELLASPKMKEVVDELEKEYDYIIYDTPPVFVVTDAAALGRYMDGAVLVVKHNATDKNVVLKAKKNLENAGVKIFGAIYSEFSEKTGSYPGYNYNYYYYDSQRGDNGDVHKSSEGK
ncbi:MULTISPECIES: CpsD/CapB family tyrosine-protein kinase [unclassified Ruminococcus]|uniref:CpsD/CapB family tyrosine-protein kinase n=1 Tax=unclassified Ruminococcus TaxID=2608920 RepID=UPI00210B5D46|nr:MULTISPECIES: CpsD/CapB family tyrosine-protein kinase [unclassified Ruminococcus]MCQ4022566.1 polysaccharide biosynthesis tyrosine autokinase [Ruminococcus sp. zg-924]MCQ4114806.1 polysaccharide biosynthesis tyrosine autokinase [Ruminococcus sp. zg-921]